MYVRIALSPWLRKARSLRHRMRCQQTRLCEVSTDPSGRQIGAHFANCSVREIGAHFVNCSVSETGAQFFGLVTEFMLALVREFLIAPS